MAIMPDVPAAILAALPDPSHVTVRETHISWVLLSGEFAWKVKKPVTLPFLDYGSVDKRRACCEAELRLNRRFAPDLYLAVVTLADEPAVKMLRFDEARRLDHVSQQGDLTGAHLSQLARDLVRFQAMAHITPAFGTADRIRTDALENFDALDRLMPQESALLARLRAWTESEWQNRRDDFERRRSSGRVREGHGDLHLGNLVLLDDRVVPFDGVEFNEDFRCLDVASEVAFTLLDLLDHGRPGLASWLLNEWLTWSGDHDALSVLRFYLVYRAMVRAKVAALRGSMADVQEAAGYLALAARLIEPRTASLVITCGPAGCGKTHAARRRLATAKCLDTVCLRSDVERKRLHGLAPDAASGGTIYDAASNVRTYARLAELAEPALQEGWSVIVDAAFLKRSERDAFRALAGRLGLPFAIIAPTASATEMARRIVVRQGDASEATPDVLARQLATWEPLAADELPSATDA